MCGIYHVNECISLHDPYIALMQQNDDDGNSDDNDGFNEEDVDDDTDGNQCFTA